MNARHRSRPLRAVVSVVALAVLGLTPAQSAMAESPTEVVHGWWTQAAAAPGVPGALVAPDAPTEGLVVQGGADGVGPISFAALAFSYEAGSVPTVLRLPLASGSVAAGTALQACAVLGPVNPASGGPMSEAPSYDCSAAVPATVEADAVTFDVSALATSADELKVALLAAGPGDRIVFAKPDVSVLTLRDVGSSSSAPEPAPEPEPAEVPEPASFGSEVVALPPAFDLLAEALPPALPGSAAPSVAEPVAAGAPVLPEVPQPAGLDATAELAAAGTDEGPSASLALLAALGLLVGAVLWGAASQAAARPLPSGPDVDSGPVT
jgi:hypothetical protein